MDLREKIEEWKRSPNALGSESKASVIVGEVAAALGETIPDNVNVALKTLALRGTMRDIASAIQCNEERERNPNTPSFHDVVDAGAASCGLSWTEALAVITSHLDEQMNRPG